MVLALGAANVDLRKTAESNEPVGCDRHVNSIAKLDNRNSSRLARPRVLRGAAQAYESHSDNITEPGVTPTVTVPSEIPKAGNGASESTGSAPRSQRARLR
jgi:hypothetical protein